MNVIYGFGGVRSDGPVLSFVPSLPKRWKRFAFRLLVHDSVLQVQIDRRAATFTALSGPAVPLEVFGKRVSATAAGVSVKMPPDRLG